VSQQSLQSHKMPPSLDTRKKAATFPVTWAVLIALMGLMFSGVFLSRYAPDESQWIYTARYLELFEKRDFHSPEWHSYWTSTQPPLARYVMGTSLTLAGYDFMKLNGAWDFSRTFDENVAHGNMPAPGILFWARLPMGLIAAGAVLLLYFIGKSIGGQIAGVGAAAWLAINPHSRELMTRAEADGMLVFLMLLGLLVATNAVSENRPTRAPSMISSRYVAYALLLGLVVGLATATKLTGVLGLAAFFAVLLADATVRRFNDPNPDRVVSLRNFGRRLLAATASTIGPLVVAFFAFVGLNPALYDHPVTSSVDLFTFRQAEMSIQIAAFPTEALPEGLPRFQNAVIRTLFTYSVSAELFHALVGDRAGHLREILPFDMLLVLAGLASALTALFSGWNSYRRAQVVSEERHDAQGIGPAGVALVFTATYFVGISTGLALDWDRYTLPLWVFAALWAGVGIDWVWRWSAALISARRIVSTSRNDA
jgi:hypothetical protein